MTDKRSIGVRLKSDGARECRSRMSKLSQNRMQTKRRVIGLQDSQSPSYHKSFNYRKAFTTPKRRPRTRYNSCYSGDSPNDTESPLQDIIWDPNSPTQSVNGNGDGRVIEISEIVNRIAPKVERPKEGDSVLQWIGDSAVPCTPEIRQPRVRRISARQSNVEDLMKLAKQFDINMTRQDKEKQQKSIENLNQLNKSQIDGTTKITPASVAIMTEEEELRALFDGPTQHLSGRLSPPSANCTPEGRTNPAALAGQSSSAAFKNASAPKASEVDFDDDWENDDLLNDSFVLEMTQNQVPLNGAEKPCATQLKSCSRKCKSVAKTNASVSNGRDICLQIQQSTSKSSTFTRTHAEVQTSTQSTFRLKPQDQTTEKLLRTSLVDQVKHQAQLSEGKTPKDCEASGQTSTATFDGVSKEDLKSLFESDGLWNDDDDDLLCQACDDVERISASQEEQRHSKDYAELDKSRSLTSRNTIHAETMAINSKSPHVFVRSNSVPCSSGSSGLKQNYGVLATTKGSSSGMESYIPSYYGQAQNKLTEVKNASAPSLGFVRGTSQTVMPKSITVGKASNSHHFTFKRHLSDSATLANKVFISSPATVKCSAAEIDRKKQEAIARRRLQMQASQKNGAPT
ncbi:ewing's tumor-associated antigen 1 homolog [Xyrauchen texanus]|uniref:ewing's tumor-associated antigen 1 homolog n=1 Tax=Xyrauchen texanus TaxID=154827 RepID=UPI002242526E|nr:ewing's tumor-associated antigen 1 homolog [Xyrauchen texanus]